MNQLIGLLLPGIISLKMNDRFLGKTENLRERIEMYFCYVLFINLFSYIVTVYKFKTPLFIFTNQFTIKYIILSLVFAVIIPLVRKIFKNNVNFDKEKLLKILKSIEIVRENLYNNVNFQLSIEKIFITILR